jgi:hypothetical protein
MMRIQAYAGQKGRTFVALSLYEAVSENTKNTFLILLST